MIEETNNPSSVDISRGGNFTFLITYNDRGTRIPVKGARIIFSLNNNKGDISLNSVSDNNGIVICKIKTLTGAVKNNNLNARLDQDFQGIYNLGRDYSKYYGSLVDSRDKIIATVPFSSYSGVNSSIYTAATAFLDDGSLLIEIPGLESAAQSALLNNGYMVNKISSDIALSSIQKAGPAALEQIKAGNIDRVLILSVSIDSKPQFSNDLWQIYRVLFNIIPVY